MSYQVLARKYRPQKFSDVIGQEHVTRTLKNAIEQQRIAHGYIFSGHRGIGKTTIARILAMALNCRSAETPVPEPCGKCDSCTEIRAGSSVDVIEIDAATNRGIDEIRELREAARYRPARDRFKIWILDEAHQITDAAFNALLKTLEEPPGHVVFMMATTQPEDIPQTIRSRCQHFSFHAVKFDDIVGQLRDIARAEGIQADDNAIAMLAEAGDGSMRDALSIMDQAIACCGTSLTAELVRGLVGAVPGEVLEDMMNAVARNSSEEVLRQVDKLLTEGQNPAHFARQLVRFLRNATVAKVAGKDSSLLQISSDERARVGRVADQFGEEDLTRLLQIMLRTHSELGYKQEQRFHLELGLLKMAHAQRLLPLEQLLSGAVPATSGTPTPRAEAPRPTAAPRSAEPASAPRPSPARPSPFEMDRARKSNKPEMSSDGATALAVQTAPEPVVRPQGEIKLEEVRAAVVAAMEDNGHRTFAGMLGAGSWALEQNEVAVKVNATAAVVEMSFGKEVARLANQAAAAASGRPLKIRLIAAPAASGNGGAAPRPVPPSTGTTRARALEEPLVKKAQELFNAEIRSIIDQKK
jgi:DNA polymerase-3 subunit gamma/tau